MLGKVGIFWAVVGSQDFSHWDRLTIENYNQNMHRKLFKDLFDEHIPSDMLMNTYH